LGTGKFEKATLSQVLVEEDMGGVTYSIQYRSYSREALDTYYREDADTLRNEGLKKFADKMLSFRKAKKYLGQHFLNDESVAEQISDSLLLKGYKNVLEIGPGMGVLTKYLLKKDVKTYVIEIDSESVEYLQANYLNLAPRIIEKDFLKYDLNAIFNQEPFAIIGNFPYNISTQIVFKTLEMRDQIPEFSGMFQKEVAQRICSKEGSKVYGILSVLTQAFYNAEYL